MSEKLFTVTLNNGYVAIQCGPTEAILKEEGTRNVKLIVPATEEDIAWVKGMGGYVPEGGNK